MRKRLLTFGCSFTQYSWPTWADILAKEFEEFCNWGCSGGGNQFIFHSIVESFHRDQINVHDTVIIMWSNIMREDRYIKGRWKTPGNIYTQKVYDNHFINSYIDIRGNYLRDCGLIFAADQILHNQGCKVVHLSMVPLTNYNQYDLTVTEQTDIEILYQSTLNKIRPSVFETLFNFDWSSRPRVNNDPHPTPAEHMEIIDRLLPEFELSNETRTFALEWEHKVRSTNYEPYLTNIPQQRF